MAIETSVEVNGAKKFEQDFKNMQQAGKTLAAEMGALAAQFENADDKEAALTKVSDKLSDQIANQRAIVDKLAAAVAEETKEKGENANSTEKLREKLAKAETELAKLEGTTAEEIVGMKNLGEEEKTAGKEAENASGKMGALTVALGNLISDAVKAGFNFLVDSLKSVVNYFKEATTGAAAYADEILELAAKTSLSTDTLQEYKYMADLVDTDLSTITGSLTKLTKNMSSAADGNKAMNESFAALGISVKDSEGHLRSSNDVFLEAIAALGKIDNEAERDAAAMELFGKKAQDLNPLIEAGSDALDGFRKEAHDVGYVLNEETLDRLGAVQDGFDRLGLAADSAKNQIGAAIGEQILPYLETLVAAVQALVGGGDIEDFANSVTLLIGNLADDLSAALPGFLDFGKKVIENLLLGIQENEVEIGYGAGEIVQSLALFIIDNLPLLVDTALKLLLYFVDSLDMEKLIPAAIQMVLTIADGLLSHVGDIISAVLGLIDGIVAGLTSDEGINKILEAIPTLIMSLITGILNNLDKIIAAGIKITVNLAYGLIQAIPQLVMMLPQIFNAVVSAFKDFDWSSLGVNIMENVGEGVISKAQTLVQWVKDGFQISIDWIKDLGTKALEWGKDMISGFGKGITNKANELLNKVKSVAQSIKGYLHFTRPDVGPLRDYEKWMPDFMKGLAQGIENNAWRVEDALRNVSANMSIAAAVTPGVGSAAAGGMRTTNYGGVSINVYGAQGQDVSELADIVMEKMQSAVVRREAVYA